MDSVSKQTQLNVSTNTPQLTSSPKNGRKLESIVRYSLYFVYNIIIFEVFKIVCSDRKCVTKIKSI